jgi:DNA polymerase III delta prime subunit
LNNEGQEFNHFFGYGTGLTYLFYGQSGTGKTMLAHALANHFECKLFTLNVEDVDKEHISFDEALQYIFREARLVNGIVFLDECDDILGEDSSKSRDFLIEIEKSNCFTILASNKTMNLDPALDRRVNLKVNFELPNESQRKEIWQALKPDGVEFGSDVDLDVLSARYNFSGGLIKNVILMASRKKSNGLITLTMDEIEHAASHQVTSMFESLGRSYEPTTELKDLDLEEAFKKKLTRFARNWVELQKDGIGLVISSSCFTHSMACTEALVNESGKVLCEYSLKDLLQGDPRTGSSRMTVNRGSGEEIKLVDQIFKDRPGQEEVLVFVDRNGLIKEILEESKKPTEWKHFLNQLNEYSGTFILVTLPFDESKLPAELPFSLYIPNPSKALQIETWKKHIGLSSKDMTELVTRFPMHLDDIVEVAEQAKAEAVLFRESSPCIEDVLLFARRKFKRTTLPLLFG